MGDLPAILTTPQPDEAHEALRLGVLQVVEDLAGQLQRINDALLLLGATVDFAQGVLNTTKAARIQLATVTTAVAGLTARVDALNPPVPPDVPAETDPPTAPDEEAPA